MSSPLDGIRVLDLSWIIAGPTAARIMAAMGAEVIKVGSARRPDPAIRGAAFQSYNQSKLYCSLNISKPEGLELAKRLVAISEVMIENFAGGVIERLGLGYEVLTTMRPDIIMVSASGKGHSGPDKDQVAYGSLLQYNTGWNSISGYPGGGPVSGGTWADPWAGMELAMVTVAALVHREATGQGQYVDCSMAEGLIGSIPEAVLDRQMNHRARPPMGNKDDRDAPHGVYPCKGDDQWVAIAVTTDVEWRALCRTIDRPDLATDVRFVHAKGRKQNEDILDAAITEWTSSRHDYEAMHLLQEAGVPAGPSLDATRVLDDPHLRRSGYFVGLQTSDGGLRDLPGLPWRFDCGPGPRIEAAPTLGQHNEYVFKELLGLSDSEIARLVEDQIIY